MKFASHLPGLLLAALLCWSAGCQYDMDSVPFVAADSSAPADSRSTPDRTPGDILQADLWSQQDTGVTDKGCVTGTADHCSKCGDRCPGPDQVGTKRLCNGGTCSLECDGHHYDVDGKVSNGCEVLDPWGGHDSEAKAWDLGQMTDCSTSPTKTVTGNLPSDLRSHVQPPFLRVNGTPKWFKVRLNDVKGCWVNPKITLDVSAMPKAATYQLDPKYVCDHKGNVLHLNSEKNTGGKSFSMSPVIKCTLASDDSGVILVKVAKLSPGSVHSAASFKLTIEP